MFGDKDKTGTGEEKTRDRDDELLPTPHLHLFPHTTAHPLLAYSPTIPLCTPSPFPFALHFVPFLCFLSRLRLCLFLCNMRLICATTHVLYALHIHLYTYFALLWYSISMCMCCDICALYTHLFAYWWTLWCVFQWFSAVLCWYGGLSVHGCFGWWFVGIHPCFLTYAHGCDCFGLLPSSLNTFLSVLFVFFSFCSLILFFYAFSRDPPAVLLTHYFAFNSTPLHIPSSFMILLYHLPPTITHMYSLPPFPDLPPLFHSSSYLIPYPHITTTGSYCPFLPLQHALPHGGRWWQDRMADRPIHALPPAAHFLAAAALPPPTPPCAPVLLLQRDVWHCLRTLRAPGHTHTCATHTRARGFPHTTHFCSVVTKHV